MIGLYVMIYNRLLRAWAWAWHCLRAPGEEESYACESFRYSTVATPTEAGNLMDKRSIEKPITYIHVTLSFLRSVHLFLVLNDDDCCRT